VNAEGRTHARRRHLLTLRDITPEELDWIVRRGVRHAEQVPEPTLRGLIVGTYFAATSTRTRTAFTAGARRLGAEVISYGPSDLQLNTGEGYGDTARVLGSMIDALVVRAPHDDECIQGLAASRDLAVVNAMSASEHPTQAISDLSCLHFRLGWHVGVRILYLGEGNNTASALVEAAGLTGGRLDLRTPPGYGLAPDLIASADARAQRLGGNVSQAHDLAGLPDDVDAIYTTRWETTGTQKNDARWRSAFEPFRVSQTLLDRFPSASFMHDLPAHRGEEVEATVLDGPRSIVFEQAAMKMWSAMAVLEWCLSA
jgi:ornithine carbamoyltransferase